MSRYFMIEGKRVKRVFEIDGKIYMRCCGCKEVKGLDNFRNCKSGKLGKNHYCRPCDNKKSTKNSGLRDKLLRIKKPKVMRARDAAKRVYPKRDVCSINGCVDLGERHHPDYNKPKEIIWLCRKHHIEFHKGILTLN